MLNMALVCIDESSPTCEDVNWSFGPTSGSDMNEAVEVMLYSAIDFNTVQNAWA